MKKFLGVVAVFAMSTVMFAADSYRVSLYQKTTVNGTEFKAGDIKLEGKAEELSVDLAGAGDVDTRQLAVQRATVNLRGAGDVKVRAEKTLEANLRGKGDIRYTGNPEEVIQNISGLGDVKPL